MKTINDYAELVKEKHALNETIAPVEADETDASKAYQVGEQLIMSGILYDVIAAISEHDVITTTGSGANIAPAGPISAKIQTLTNNVSVLAENGAVNMLPNSNSCTRFDTSGNNGSTLQENSDDSITVNVTQLSNFRRFFANNFKEGTYKITIGKNATAPWGVFLNSSPTEIGTYKQLCRIEIGQNEAEFTVTNTDISTYPYVFVNQSCDVETATYYPMIADVDYTGGYVPYAMTNRELTKEVDRTLVDNASTLSFSVKAAEMYIAFTQGGGSSNSYSYIWLVIANNNGSVRITPIREGTQQAISITASGSDVTINCADNTVIMGYTKI